MAQRKSFMFYLAVVLVVLSALTQEAEARRKILRGRRVMTRNYYHGNAVPAWAISLMAGIGMLIVGGILYVVMRKLVLSAETGSMNTYQPAMQAEEV
ncbi:uncharacterized protein LOC113233901 [Hyposmocoma kahamanoa]|uniref:uncharacterized protein LOC113233901 n=1 Tax=Hyposmocoma kahamanoa TaxID=1477025 RepID=UPI000E6D788B|nr:uncharacterized protein LOC113233901 [Hyposmocoma kahamanoa]